MEKNIGYGCGIKSLRNFDEIDFVMYRLGWDGVQSPPKPDLIRHYEKKFIDSRLMLRNYRFSPSKGDLGRILDCLFV